MSNPDTLFQQIIRREIPAEIVYEDDACLAFHDISPQAPTHVLVIPKRLIRSLRETVDEDSNLLGHLLVTANKIANTLQLERGYRIVINAGPDGGQSVNHLHVHLLGGRALTGPPG